MPTKAEKNVFFSHKELWCYHAPVVNFETKTIEYRTRAGFLTWDDAEKAYKKASRLFLGELAKLKESSPCPFTFTEYLKYWFEQIYVPASTSGSTKVKYHWIIYYIILSRVTADPLLPYVDAEYMENLIESCRNYCTSAESAVYKLLCSILYSAWSRGFLETYLVSEITEREESKSDLHIYTREKLKVFLNAVYEDPYAHHLEFFLALFCGLRPGEILGLTYNNFDFSTQTLDIHKQYTKDGHLPSESADSKYSYKELEGDRYRSVQIPDFIYEELVLRKEKNTCFYLAHPDKKGPGIFCISCRGKVKTLETLNTRLKYITENNCLPTKYYDTEAEAEAMYPIYKKQVEEKRITVFKCTVLEFHGYWIRSFFFDKEHSRTIEAYLFVWKSRTFSTPGGSKFIFPVTRNSIISARYNQP